MSFLFITVIILLLLLKSIPVSFKPSFHYYHSRITVFAVICLLCAVFLLNLGLFPFPALIGAVAITLFLAEKIPELFTAHGTASGTPRHTPPPSSFLSPMNKEEARAILGVQPNASKVEIKRAYHALIMKNHPDHGGSSYLAIKINQARDVLLLSLGIHSLCPLPYLHILASSFTISLCAISFISFAFSSPSLW